MEQQNYEHFTCPVKLAATSRALASGVRFTRIGVTSLFNHQHTAGMKTLCSLLFVVGPVYRRCHLKTRQ